MRVMGERQKVVGFFGQKEKKGKSRTAKKHIILVVNIFGMSAIESPTGWTMRIPGGGKEFRIPGGKGTVTNW